MNITKKHNYDYENYSTIWNELYVFDNIRCLKDVKNDIDAIYTLVNNNISEIPDEEFVKLVSNFYDISITKQDILKILSKMNGVVYDKIQCLNTRVVTEELVTEGHARDFSWWVSNFLKGYYVACSDDFSIDKNRFYTKEEILEMINNKQIVCLQATYKEVFFDLEIEKEDNFVLTDKTFYNINFGRNYFEGNYYDFDKLNCDDTEFSKEVYHYAVKPIRKRLYNKKLLIDCKDILIFIKENYHIIEKVLRKNEDDKNINEYNSIASDIKSKLYALDADKVGYDESHEINDISGNKYPVITPKQIKKSTKILSRIKNK